MGALSGVLCQGAADTEAIRSVAAATQVLNTGLDVGLRVQDRTTGAPQRRAQELVTLGMLRRKEEEEEDEVNEEKV